MRAALSQKPIRTGFMAIELVMVMGIILVLFCLYFGGVFGGRNPRNFSECARNLQFIHIALSTYASDHNDRFPFVARADNSEVPLALLIPKYTSQTASFICPASGDRSLPEGESFAKRRISYAYVMGLSRTNDPMQFVLSDEQIDTLAKDAGARVFSSTNRPPGANHGPHGGNLLLIDGSVEKIAGKAPRRLSFGNGALLNPKPKR